MGAGGCRKWEVEHSNINGVPGAKEREREREDGLRWKEDR
jgi:hypothetical protein